MDSECVLNVAEIEKAHTPRSKRCPWRSHHNGRATHSSEAGKKHKAPGYDGISHDFFQLIWETTQYEMLEIMNQMFMDEKLTDSQKHGIIVCLKKIPRPTQPEDYRPLNLLNADFKILARIILNSIRPWFKDLLHPSQHCRVQDNNILWAISAIRDTVAEAELTHIPVCILSLDFKGAFDNIALSYLFAMLDYYGFSSKFRKRLMRMYSNATSSIQVNGHISSFIPIKCSIRHWCPLSIVLFTMCLLQYVLKDTRASFPLGFLPRQLRHGR